MAILHCLLNCSCHAGRAPNCCLMLNCLVRNCFASPPRAEAGLWPSCIAYSSIAAMQAVQCHCAALNQCKELNRKADPPWAGAGPWPPCIACSIAAAMQTMLSTVAHCSTLLSAQLPGKATLGRGRSMATLHCLLINSCRADCAVHCHCTLLNHCQVLNRKADPPWAGAGPWPSCIDCSTTAAMQTQTLHSPQPTGP